MTVNKVGRPSKALERRRQILIATHAVVARYGMAGATLARIAEQAGLQRTLVVHYFGDRDAVMSAFIGDTVASYGDEMLRDDSSMQLADRVESFFAPGVYAANDDLTVWLELVALAARNDSVRNQLRDLWNLRWLPALESRLQIDYPTAPIDSIKSTAYALTCLFEAHWALSAQGLGQASRQEQAQAAVRTLLNGLAPRRAES